MLVFLLISYILITYVASIIHKMRIYVNLGGVGWRALFTRSRKIGNRK